MTTFTWKRGIAGTSQGSGPDTFLLHALASYPSTSSTTVRRIIIDYGFEYLAEDKTGSDNAFAKTTLGVIATTDSAVGGNPPTAGPADDPSANWLWWQGVWFSNLYGEATTGAVAGIFSATGRIDREVNTSNALDTVTTYWLCANVQDVDSDWTTIDMIAWWQFLSAPTVA